MRIAVDAMGGDFAPVRIIKGCLAADLGEDALVLVGDREQIQEGLAEAGAPADACAVQHAAEVIGMHESPVEGLRNKPDASVVVATKLLATGEADAIVSAGNTGATVAAASTILKTLPGVKRPGIAVPLPTREGLIVLIDAGANLACRPAHLVQYALMAAGYMSRIYGVESPRVGLLNVGEEAKKGTELVQATHALLSEANLNYVGSVEGHDLFAGACDVVVTDGFTGNCLLKANEGFAHAMLANFNDALAAHVEDAVRPQVLGAIAARVDYSEYGGAPLLGVNGVVTIAHGRSDEKAIASAVQAAARMAHSGLNDNIVREVSALSNIGT